MKRRRSAFVGLNVRPSFCCLVLYFFITSLATARADTQPVGKGAAVYGSLKSFGLGYRSLRAENLVLKKDRVTITFRDGMLYFAAPIEGKVRGAVFIGSGSFQATPPPGYELDNVRRMLKADEVSSDFKTAVLRFTDDTYSAIGEGAKQDSSAPPEAAARLAADLDTQVLEETGANLSARQLISILNHESPGFFFIQVAGGRLGRFAFLLDPQTRIPAAYFEINAGESGVIYSYEKSLYSPEVWMAFFGEEVYQQGKARYAEANDLILVSRYNMLVDVTEPKKMLKLTVTMDCVSRSDQLIAIPFVLGEDLDRYDDQRRKKQLHLTAAHLADGAPVEVVQESWEGGFTLVLPAAVKKDQKFTAEISAAGEFMFESQGSTRTYFPLRTTTWYPRHGYLRRSAFDVNFLHRKSDVVASIGIMAGEKTPADHSDFRLTEFKMDDPVALTSFSVGSYEIHKDTAKIGDTSLPLEFYSVPGNQAVIKEDFILAELGNSVRYFSTLFGKYPYPLFRGVFHPFAYGQGFPTTVMIPNADSASKFTYLFLAHETSHQWWGDNVLWRSYRDQWLSEGFAEYSGLLYTASRDKQSSEMELIHREREHLIEPPRTLTGIRSGHVTDVGPLVMGQRLETSESRGAYQALIYSKGALVLRMLHYLFTDPQTGDGRGFFEMMSEFARQHAGGVASTDAFFAVANARVQQTPLAQKFGYKDLNWFYRQWVLQTYLPSYRLTYELKDQPDGSVLVEGTLAQDGVPDSEHWFMPIPLVFTFAKGSSSMVTLAVQGKESPVKVKLPARPRKVELDPQMWILSEKTSASGK